MDPAMRFFSRRAWAIRGIVLVVLAIAAILYARQFHPEAEDVGAQRAQLAARDTTARAPKIDAAALITDVRTLSSPAMEGRGVGTPGGARARAYVLQRMRAIGLQPAFGAAFEQPFRFTPGRGIRFWRKAFWDEHPAIDGANVVGRLAGRAADATCIVVSAHYDHLGIRAGRLYPGADDNASGVAALLAAAAWFQAHPPRHCLLFAAFDGEEKGLRGARAFVAAPPVPLARIAANINFDMLSRNPAGELFVSGLYANPQLKALLDPLRTRVAPTLLYGHDHPRPVWDDNDWTHQSDQGVFEDQHLPWLYFGVEDHPAYHQPSDTFAGIDQPFYIGVADAMVDVIAALDAAPDGRLARAP
jgi:hypothetical protein